MHVSCSLTSASLLGIEAMPITVEVALTSGLPGISIVGMADTSIQEARERVKAAIKAAGFAMPQEKIVINLAPGDMRKSGSAFDLPIAIGILVATGQVDPRIIMNRLFVGELSLEGSVRPVKGMLAYGACAAELGSCIVSGSQERVPINGLSQSCLRTLARLRADDPFDEVRNAKRHDRKKPQDLDFSDIAGHETAKRALQICAAGNHGLLMVGPPGSGKTMLASRLHTILPELGESERLEAAVVHSVAGESIDEILEGVRPFRKPHHSASMAGLLGGGTPVRPGEVSLAHCGVLFLDELAEFKSSVLQGLRQPIETGNVIITRAQGSIRMPARFALIAATNPCPCGHLGDKAGECRCTMGSIRKYQNRIGGPLIDRFQIQLDVQKLPLGNVLESGNGIPSQKLREGVDAALAFRAWRDAHDIDGNVIRASEASASKPASQIIKECKLGDESKSFILSLSSANGMSGRSLINILKVARTIADMGECADVAPEHLAEAAGFRLNESLSNAS